MTVFDSRICDVRSVLSTNCVTNTTTFLVLWHTPSPPTLPLKTLTTINGLSTMEWRTESRSWPMYCSRGNFQKGELSTKVFFLLAGCLTLADVKKYKQQN